MTDTTRTLDPLTNPSDVKASTTKTQCRACLERRLEYVLDLGNLMLSDFLTETQPDPPRVRLKLVRCRDCGLLQLSETTDPDLLYRKFWYRSGVTQTMRNEMLRLVTVGINYGRSRGAWLDIGANDGTLLGFLDPSCWHRVGYEPAVNLADELRRNCETAISDYYPSAWNSGHKFDVITSAAMFYDLDDPHPFLDKIREDLADGGVWINQLSYTPEMVRTMAFDNICHEHLCYYDVTTLQRLLGIHGLRIHDVHFNAINGGSMCCVIVHQRDPRDVTSAVTAAGAEEGHHDLRYYQAFADKVVAWRETARKRIFELREEGKVVHLYGASTKGNTLLQYCDFTNRDFHVAAERSPQKWGLRTVASNIPIVSEEASRSLHPDAYFVLPWAFRDEFIAREQAYLANGGTLIFPLPEWSEVRA